MDKSDSSTITKTAEVTAMCDGVCAAFPDQRERRKALKAVLWRFRGPHGEYVGYQSPVDGGACVFVPESAAVIFDGRDNEAAKLRWYEAFLGPLTIEVLPCQR